MEENATSSIEIGDDADSGAGGSVEPQKKAGSPRTILGGSESSIGESSGSFDPDMLPIELRNEPSLRNFKDWNDLAKSYVHAVKKLGAPGEELIRVPNGSDGDLSEVYDRLGRPETPDGYDLNGETPDHFRKFAHSTGLSQEQAGKFVDYVSSIQKSEEEKVSTYYEQQQLDYQQQLSKEWGDDYKKNVELGRRAFLQFSDEDTLKFMEETGLGNHPGLNKMFTRIGRSMNEDGRLMSGDDGRIGGMSPATAEAKIKELQANKDFNLAYRSAEHPKHAEAVKEMQSLYEYLG